MLIEIRDHASGVFSLTMNNELKRNALSAELLAELAAGLHRLEGAGPDQQADAPAA